MRLWFEGGGQTSPLFSAVCSKPLLRRCPVARTGARVCSAEAQNLKIGSLPKKVKNENERNRSRGCTMAVQRPSLPIFAASAVNLSRYMAPHMD